MSVVPQTLIALVLWKDRIAAVARGLRAEAGGTRWALGRDYAAFLSHYKKEAAAPSGKFVCRRPFEAKTTVVFAPLPSATVTRGGCQ